MDEQKDWGEDRWAHSSYWSPQGQTGMKISGYIFPTGAHSEFHCLYHGCRWQTSTCTVSKGGIRHHGPCWSVRAANWGVLRSFRHIKVGFSLAMRQCCSANRSYTVFPPAAKKDIKQTRVNRGCNICHWDICTVLCHRLWLEHFWCTSCAGLTHGTVRSAYSVHCTLQRYIKEPWKQLSKILRAEKTMLERLDKSVCSQRWVVCVVSVALCRLWVKPVSLMLPKHHIVFRRKTLWYSGAFLNYKEMSNKYPQGNISPRYSTSASKGGSTGMKLSLFPNSVMTGCLLWHCCCEWVL